MRRTMQKQQIDANAAKAIEEIIKKGNDAVVRRKGDGLIILEDKKTIKYSTQ